MEDIKEIKEMAEGLRQAANSISVEMKDFHEQLTEALLPSFMTFRGSKIPKTPQAGDTVMVKEPKMSLSIFDGEKWISLDTLSADSISSGILTLNPDTTVTTCSYETRITKMENCHNCGGTIDDTGHCRYCGSLVYLIERRYEWKAIYR